MRPRNKAKPIGRMTYKSIVEYRKMSYRILKWSKNFKGVMETAWIVETLSALSF